MKKNKAIILLSLVSLIMAFVLAMSFVKFTSGIKKYNSVIGAIDTDYDVSGGVSYTLTLNRENEKEVENVDDVLNVLDSRLNELGYKAYSLSAQKEVNDGVKDYSIRICVEDTDTVDSDIKAVSAYGTVKFFGGAEEDPSTEIMNEKQSVASAKYAGENAGSYLVEVVFTDYGYNALVEELDANSTYYLKLTLGDQTLLSGSISKDAINNKTIYINTGTEAAARQTAMQIRTGGLDYLYDVSDAVKVSPLMGENAALYAGLAVGILLVVAIAGMLVVYGGFGLIGSLSVLAFALIDACMMVAIPVIKVSAPAIIGIGLSLILCIDGLVLTVKRIREESANGKTVKAAVKTGYKRAFMPIINSNVIVLITALSILAFAKGALVGFGWTLLVGVVISFITNVLLSKMFTALILPLSANKEKFLKLKKAGE